MRFLEEGFLADEAAALELHLRACAVCRATLEQLASDESRVLRSPGATFRALPVADAPDQPAVTDADQQFLQDLAGAMAPFVQRQLVEAVNPAAASPAAEPPE